MQRTGSWPIVSAAGKSIRLMKSRRAKELSSSTAGVNGPSTAIRSRRCMCFRRYARMPAVMCSGTKPSTRGTAPATGAGSRRRDSGCTARRRMTWNSRHPVSCSQAAAISLSLPTPGSSSGDSCPVVHRPAVRECGSAGVAGPAGRPAVCSDAPPVRSVREPGPAAQQFPQ